MEHGTSQVAGAYILHVFFIKKRRSLGFWQMLLLATWQQGRLASVVQVAGGAASW